MEDLGAKEDLSYQEYPVKDFRDVRGSYAKQEDQDEQGAMEAPHRGRVTEPAQK
jgi:hypothetical protein